MAKNLLKNIPTGHRQAAENVLGFINGIKADSLTKKNVVSFLEELVKIDPFCLTEFELSFKAGDNLVEIDKIRLLNLDAKAYSYLSEKNYLQRLKEYYAISRKKIKNPTLKRVFKAFQSISGSPLDLYIGADIKKDYYLLAFWLIFGGAKRNGKITFIDNSAKVIRKIFKELNIKSAFNIKEKILNLGFDIDDSRLFYKIYYFLNKNNFSLLSFQEREKVDKIIDFLSNRCKYWFFVSERYEADSCLSGRKKVYLEFLDDMVIGGKKTENLLRGLLKIIGCRFDFGKLKGVIKSIPSGKIVILAFEPDGTTTFYIRL